jgi:UDP-glucose 4-epimerase
MLKDYNNYDDFSVRVVVTGASGVIGAEVVHRLLERGDSVLASSRSPDSGPLAQLDGEIELIAADIRDSARMRSMLEASGAEVVIHLAASLPATAEADPVAAVELNVLATAALFELAASAGIERFIHASSKSAYGPLPDGAVVDERYLARPTSCYGATKLAAEIAIGAQALRGGPEASALRFATIYAPGKADRHAGASVLSRLLDDAVAGRPVRIASGGDQVDDMIWIGDAAAGVIAAAHSPTALSPLYNISTGVPMTLRAFADGVRAALPDASIEVGPGLDYMGPGFVYGVLDATLAREELGFLADADPASGARRFAAAVGHLPAC